MLKPVFALSLFLMSTISAFASEQVIAGLSQNRVAITANFDGSEILIFGAVKRESPAPDDVALDVIITVSGPAGPVQVRRKSKRLGIWINTQGVEIDSAPTFYAVATTRPLAKILSHTEDLRNKITIKNAIRSVGVPSDVTDSGNFTEALIRIRESKGLYQTLENEITLSDDTLFRTSVALPANLTEGTYTARFLLLRDKKVISEYQTGIEVRKEGLERWIYNLAYQTPLVYGFLSLFLAIFAGWAASVAFRYLRR